MRTLLRHVESLLDRLLGRWQPSVLWGASDVPVERMAPESRAVFRTFLLVAIGLMACQTVVHLVNVVFFDLSIRRLNADKESTLWAWAGTCSIFAAGAGAALLLLVARERRRTLFLLSAALMFLSMDEMVSVHELLNVFTGSARQVWPLVYSPLMAAVFVVLWRLSAAFSPSCRVAVRGSLVALGCAVVFEFLSKVIVDVGFGRGDIPYELEVVAEEGCELAGWLVLAGALLAPGLDVLLRRRPAANLS